MAKQGVDVEYADGEWRVVFDAGSPAADEPDDATKALLDAATDCP